MTYAYESHHDDDSILCMGISFEQNRIRGNLKLKGKEQQKKYFCAIYLKSYNTWSCGNSMVQQATPDLKRVQSTVRSTCHARVQRLDEVFDLKVIKVLINTEVHVTLGSIALDGGLDLKWLKYSSNFEVPSREGPKARRSSWPQLIKVLIYVEVQSWEGPLCSTEYLTSNDQGTCKYFLKVRSQETHCT